MHAQAERTIMDYADEPYDPLSETDFDEDIDIVSNQEGPCVEARATMPCAQGNADASPRERIEELFSKMPQRRKIMLQILKRLDAPCRSDALDRMVDDLQKYDSSVYTGQDYASLLHDAGAIEKVSEDGSDFDENEEQQPDIVEIDGDLFYRPCDGKQVYWMTTEDGQAFLESDRPLERLASMLGEEEFYKPLYQEILEMCDEEDGCTTDKLIEAVSNNPLSHKPFLHGSHFAKRLEDCEALEWRGAWRTTEVGRQALEEGVFDQQIRKGEKS